MAALSPCEPPTVIWLEENIFGVLLEYPTTTDTGFQWGHLKNDPYTYTVSGGNGRLF